MSTTHRERAVRWGIVGLGDVCERKSGPPLWEVEGSELTAVYRRSLAQAESFTARHGHGRVAASYGELLAAPDVDIVYVATPHALHAEHAIAALEAGKHVLVEKPMALTVADCDRMIAAAEAAGRVLAVAYYRRGYPSVRRVQKLIADWAIGRPLSAAINAEFPTSHRIDLARFLFGEVEQVNVVPPGAPSPLAGVAGLERMARRVMLTMDGGAEVSFAVDWAETGMSEALSIIGERGRIDLWDLKGGSIVVSDASGRRAEEVGGLPWTHTGLVENVVAHLHGGEPLLCTGTDGRESTAALERVAAYVTSGD